MIFILATKINAAGNVVTAKGTWKLKFVEKINKDYFDRLGILVLLHWIYKVINMGDLQKYIV